MAEEDAEIALLHSMQAGQEQWNDEAEGVAEEGQPINTEDSEEQEQEQEQEKETIADEDHGAQSSVRSPPANGAISAMSGIQNPVIAAINSNPESRTSSRASNRTTKPKTVGGFIADDSDDEEDNATPISATIGLQQTPAAESVSHTPLQSSNGPDTDAVGTQDHNNTNVASTIPSVGAISENVAQNFESAQIPPASAASLSNSTQKARLPHDVAGKLEDRIREDPRGDIDAWLSLVGEHRKRNKLDDARAVYERFFKVFPSAADIWIEYAEMELANDNFFAAEQIFGKSLLTVPNVNLWSVYLNYIRRRNDLTNDVTGIARTTISQAYDFVLANVGMDKDSGRIWQDYIQFIRSAPGLIGGSGWQDQQKMDQLRKAFQKAVCVPMSTVNALWKEYDQFEMSLNKNTGRKFLQEKSPAYMSARSSNTALENITRDLKRTNLPKLPPAMGFEGDQEYLQQVEMWKRWIQWEIEDPLVLKTEELDVYQKRVLFVYKQAVMALRFWPEIWVEAAEWCINNGLEQDGKDFLSQGVAANPESCLLAFKHADYLEMVLPIEEGEDGLVSRGAAIRAPYNKVLDALYESLAQLKLRETREIARIEEAAVLEASVDAVLDRIEEDDEDPVQSSTQAREAAKANQLNAVKQGFAAQTRLISRTISFAWVALMRAMRRVQGKGKVGAAVGGSRQILNDARHRGRITSDVYVASALIEHHVYKDPAGTKIFERGAKLFPDDEVFLLEYLKHLLSIGDTTNARAVFETSVNRLAQKPETVPRTRSLYIYFHKYESEYGELSQIKKLEQRIADLFPSDPKLQRFAARYSSESFDPTAVRPIISPNTQMKPKIIRQSIEQPPQESVAPSPRPLPREIVYREERSPRPTYAHIINSPKRAFVEDSDSELNRPRKLQRGESPLKGAAGRRLDQQKRLQGQSGLATRTPFVIPRDITFLLSIIPRAELYNSSRFNPEAMVRLLSEVEIPDYSEWKARQGGAVGRRY